MKTMNSSSELSVSPIVLIATAILFIVLGLSGCNVSPPVVGSEQTDSTTIDKDADITDSKDTGVDTSINTGIIKATVTDVFDYQDCVHPPTEYVQVCTARGSKFLQQGKLGCYRCIVSYDDAGKSCQDSTDCQGSCDVGGEYVATGTTKQIGQCSTDSSAFGCRQTIENGIAGSAICVD